MSTRPPKILFIEDDTAVRDAVAAAMEGELWEVTAVPDGTDLDVQLATGRPDLAVLDIRLHNGPDGLALARRLRHDGDLPILFLTAADHLTDRLAGFDAGADDYLTKPFSVAELLARVRALLRRTGALGPATWELDDLRVNEATRQVWRGDREIQLTPTEFDILAALGARRGQVMSKDQLLLAVWEFDSYDHNIVEVHVSALRRKLEDNGDQRLLHTVRGSGYILRP